MAKSSPHVSGDAYEVVLADLRQRRDELDTAIKAVEAVRGGRSSTLSPASLTTIAPPAGGSVSEFAGLSIAEASKVVLRARGEVMHTSQIVPPLQSGGVKLTSVDPINTVNSILNRRANSVGDIVRVGRSMWALKDRQQPPSTEPEATGDTADPPLKPLSPLL